MMRLLEFVLLWVGTAALRHGNEPPDGNRKFTVSVQVTGPPWEQGLTIAVVKNGVVQTELAHNLRIELLGQGEGELINVGSPNDSYTACSYRTGQMMTTCFIGKREVIFNSQEEVKETLKMMLLVTRSGQGNEPPFIVKIDDVTIWTESGPMEQDTTWWRMIDVNGAGAIVTVLFPSTNKKCTYTVASGNDQKTCVIDGWSMDFETVVSIPFTGDVLAKFKATPNARYTVYLTIDGSGPPFDIYVNHDRKWTENHDEPVSSLERIIVGADTGDRVIFRFPNKDYAFYTVGNKKNTFVNLKGWNIVMETKAEWNDESNDENVATPH